MSKKKGKPFIIHRNHTFCLTVWLSFFCVWHDDVTRLTLPSAHQVDFVHSIEILLAKLVERLPWKQGEAPWWRTPVLHEGDTGCASWMCLGLILFRSLGDFVWSMQHLRFFLGGEVERWFGRGIFPRYDINSRNCFEVRNGGLQQKFVINSHQCCWI